MAVQWRNVVFTPIQCRSDVAIPFCRSVPGEKHCWIVPKGNAKMSLRAHTETTRMNGWHAILRPFQQYFSHGRLMMKGYVQWNSVYGWEDFASSGNRTRSARSVKSKEIRSPAYNSLVRPQVEYASSVWSPYTNENINKIEMLQRRAARWVCNDFSYSSVTEMLDNLGWRSLELRRYDARIAMFYKIVYGLVAIPVQSCFERPSVQTRHHPLTYRLCVCYYYFIFSHDSYSLE